MKCPYCTVEVHYDPEEQALEIARGIGWLVEYMTCPACDNLIVYLVYGEPTKNASGYFEDVVRKGADPILVWPKVSSRPPCPPEVPEQFAQDYREACLVLDDSPQASAALSRRCLQHLLREVAKVKPGDLANEIQQVLDSKALPSQLAEEIDAIRNVGNFAAHPMKNTKSGEILPVEPAEAEWNLEVLEALFDFYFVQPEKARKRREALNAKLAEAGKRPMK